MEAAAEWRDDVTSAFRLSIFARATVACDVRDAEWMKRINDYISGSNHLVRQQYRDGVTDKAAFDRIANQVSGEIMQWYMASLDAAAGAWRSPSVCLDLRRNTGLLEVLDFDAAHRFGG